MKLAETGAIAAPAIGPAVVTVAGIDVPLLAFGLSLGGLLLARYIAPPPLRRLKKRQERALTALLVIILFLVVTGQFGNGKPLGAGMAVICGIGLGMSGLLAIEFFGDRALAMIKAFFDPRPRD